MSRVVLASNAHYFLWIDPDWTRARLLSLFDWDRDSLQAAQAWHGFLAGGRPRSALLDELTPSAVQLASHLDELGGKRKYYGRFVARSAFSVPDDPLSKAWFQVFLVKANDDDRVHFAWELDELLKSLRTEQRAEIWGDWIRPYLKHRAQFPPPPSNKEFTVLWGWSLNLPGQLAELVESLDAIPAGGASSHRHRHQLLWKLQKCELGGNDPNLLARLVLVLLKHSEKVEPWERSQLQAVIKRLLDEGAREDLIRELVEKYLEYGGLEHQELLEQLRGRDSGTARPNQEMRPDPDKNS
jgi:hypothetical protein